MEWEREQPRDWSQPFLKAAFSRAFGYVAQEIPVCLYQTSLSWAFVFTIETGTDIIISFFFNWKAPVLSHNIRRDVCCWNNGSKFKIESLSACPQVLWALWRTCCIKNVFCVAAQQCVSLSMGAWVTLTSLWTKPVIGQEQQWGCQWAVCGFPVLLSHPQGWSRFEELSHPSSSQQRVSILLLGDW